MPEKTIETKACKKCGTSFEITDKDLEFYDKISPTFAGQKYSIPTPSFCPDCRQQRRLAWRNDRKLYRRNCDLSWKPMISIYSPDSLYKVYDTDQWWSDKWNPLDYGQDFDFAKPFFEQFDELQDKAPACAKSINSSEWSDYCNEVWFLKNCYLTFSAGYDENTFYSTWIVACHDCLDCLFVNNLKYSYECIDCKSSYNLKFSQFCQDSNNSAFLYNCTNCENCFMCSNLHNKKFYIYNKKYSEEEYNDIIEWLQKFTNSNLAKYKKEFSNLVKNTIQSPNIHNSENCSGDTINWSKNVLHSFDINDSENLKYVFFAYNCSNSYDIYTHWDNSELMYEGMWVGSNGYNILFSHHCYDNVRNIYYSNNCVWWSKNIFGCVWLRNQEYCIFNKQYSKENYEKLVPQIIEHMKTTWEWGEFFPSNISPFGYNETVANEYYPLEKEEAVAQGFNWQDKEYPVNIPEGMARIEAKDLPELEDLEDEMEKKILTTAIICEDSWKPYRIIQQELDFYKKHNIPLPKKHQDIRHINRMKFRNPRKLYDRNCDKCSVEIRTTYSPDRPETVFCKTCYEKEIL